MTSIGLAMPPDQKAFQIESTWLRSSPVSMGSFFCFVAGISAVRGGVNALGDYRCCALISLWLVGLVGFVWQWSIDRNLKRVDTLAALLRLIRRDCTDARERRIYSPYILS